MLIKALKSFTGAITMHQGEIKECKDKSVVTDLLKAGHIEKVKKVSEEDESERDND